MQTAVIKPALSTALVGICGFLIGYYIDNIVNGLYFQGVQLTVTNIHLMMIRPLLTATLFAAYGAGEYVVLRRISPRLTSLSYQIALLAAKAVTLAVILYLYRSVDPLMHNVSITTPEIAIAVDDIHFYGCYCLAMIIPTVSLYVRERSKKRNA